MAQATITYYQLLDLSTRRDFAERVFYAVGKALYGKDEKDMLVADVTVRTLQLDNTASKSSARVELHIEVASGEWPKDEQGNDLSREKTEIKMKQLAHHVCADLVVHQPTVRGLNVWCTQYPATGWATNVEEY
jgi:hypothetical protein